MNPVPYTQLSPADLFALCIYREGRDEVWDCQRGIAWVILNRVDKPSWWGHDIQSVILCPWQFSSFNPGNPEQNTWPANTDGRLIEARKVVALVSSGTDTDPTQGAVNYYATTIAPPSWTQKMIFTTQLGNTRFYRQQLVADEPFPAVDPSMGVD